MDVEELLKKELEEHQLDYRDFTCRQLCQLVVMSLILHSQIVDLTNSTRL